MRRIKARRDMAAVPSSLLVLRIPARPTSTCASESGLATCVLRPARSHPLTWAWAHIPENAKVLARTAHSIGRNPPTFGDSSPRPNLHAQQFPVGYELWLVATSAYWVTTACARRSADQHTESYMADRISEWLNLCAMQRNALSGHRGHAT